MHLSSEELKQRMAGAPLRTKQKAVSVPAINRYIAMLVGGRSPPNIEVDGNVIVEGNHCYVAGYAIGRPPKIDPYINPRPGDATYTFEEIFYDAADWGNR
jgi:hypothetical protein